MTTTPEIPGLPDSELNSDNGTAFDELARRAGAALRRPAPEDGVSVIVHRRRRQQALKATVVGGVAVATLIGALVVTPLPAVVLFRDLAPAGDPVERLKHTMWDEGVRLTRDPDGTPINIADVTLGSVFHVIPEGLNEAEGRLEEKAKAAVLLMRLKESDLHISPGREDWSYQGIVAYSKICTHVGCPVALYEQQTHHLLCPCHQSQFDITREAAVIFGPAKRPLPQLPITVDDEGYLVARSDFTEPVGPSFWERSL